MADQLEQNAVIKFYNNNAATYSENIEDHFDGLWNELLNRLKIKENHSILDLGCGTGKVIKRIIEKYSGCPLRLNGVDFCDSMIYEAQKRLAQKDTLTHQIKLVRQHCFEYLNA